MPDLGTPRKPEETSISRPENPEKCCREIFSETWRVPSKHLSRKLKRGDWEGRLVQELAAAVSHDGEEARKTFGQRIARHANEDDVCSEGNSGVMSSGLMREEEQSDYVKRDEKI